MPPTEYKLILRVGPNSGTTYSLSPAQTIIGRDASCDIVIPGSVISRQHAARVARFVDTGTNEGAELVVDGRQPKVAGYPDGHWVGASPRR